MAPLLGYWNLRGLGQHVRLLLEYTGQEYQEKVYSIQTGTEWASDKYNLGLDMPNLPYYIDGDLKLTQSSAIMYHIGRKYNMCGETEKEKAHVDMLVNQAIDLRMKYIILVYETYDTQKEQYLKELQDYLKVLSDYLCSKTWFIGDKITVADFIIYELLDIHMKMDPSCLSSFNNLQQFHRRFEELPAIKKYMASPRFISKPLNGLGAKFDIQ